MVYVKLSAPLKFAFGVYVMLWSGLRTTVPLTAALTAITVRSWPLSFPAPFESLARIWLAAIVIAES